jgi:hypothetical protein
VTPLRELIRRLPPGVEFLVVVCGAFGMPIFSSILSMGAGAGARAGRRRPGFNDAVLIGIVVFEVVQAAFLIWFLHGTRLDAREDRAAHHLARHRHGMAAAARNLRARHGRATPGVDGAAGADAGGRREISRRPIRT